MFFVALNDSVYARGRTCTGSQAVVSLPVRTIQQDSITGRHQEKLYNKVIQSQVSCLSLLTYPNRLLKQSLYQVLFLY